MKRLLIFVAVVAVSGLPARAGNILLVRGTASTPTEAERNCARTVTQRLSRLLAEAGVVHTTVNDEAVHAASLKDADVVVLGYNPYPPAAEMAALRDFAARGGRLVVFFSADPSLAELMGFRLGLHKGGEKAGRWSAMRFVPSSQDIFPPVVRQESWNIRPVVPVAEGAAVLAYWQDAEGRVLPDPAVVGSPRGAWVTHILLDDGDTDGKREMLLGLVAARAPGVWQPAAAQALLRAGNMGQFADLQDAVERITERAAGSDAEARVDSLLSHAVTLNGQLTDLYQNGKFVETVKGSRGLRLLLTEAYALSHAREGTWWRGGKGAVVRGVWDHSGTGLYPGDWPRTCRFLAEQGITDVFTHMQWAGLAHYESRILPRSPVTQTYGDQLRQCLAAARASGLRVHAWKICWRLDDAPEAWLARLRAEGRLQVTDTGRTLDSLCPSHPANVQAEIAAVLELANYPVDGIHLDYIRYRDSHACFCDGCRARFRETTRGKVREWPLHVGMGAAWKEYNRWRCAQITSFVGTARTALRKAKPEIRLSAAVFGKYPECAESVAQDWGVWLRDGAVDFVCPMNYTTNVANFRVLVRKQTAMPEGRERIFPGIGVTAMESRLDGVQTVDQVSAAREAGTPGFVLYGLTRALEAEILPVVRQAFPPPARAAAAEPAGP